SVMGVTFAMGVSLLFQGALACEAKANLHPLAFYTIEVTSPLAIRSSPFALRQKTLTLVPANSEERKAVP
ncbi:MAG: hypothetical protein ABSD98_10745, partial [Candidatus Korobacteraceae bacterium]